MMKRTTKKQKQQEFSCSYLCFFVALELLSFTPGFSPVLEVRYGRKPFQRFSLFARKPLKRFLNNVSVFPPG